MDSSGTMQTTLQLTSRALKKRPTGKITVEVRFEAAEKTGHRRHARQAQAEQEKKYANYPAKIAAAEAKRSGAGGSGSVGVGGSGGRGRLPGSGVRGRSVRRDASRRASHASMPRSRSIARCLLPRRDPPP